MRVEFSKQIADEWLELATYFESVLGVSLDVHHTEDRLRRVVVENGSRYLAAKAIADGLGCDSIYCEFAELRRVTIADPMLAWSDKTQPFLIIGRTFGGRYRIVQFREGEPQERIISKRALRQIYAGGLLLVKRAAFDIWERESSAEAPKRWFWSSLRPFSRVSRHLVAASIVGNTLAVGVSIFALQVWDRVIPAQSLNSLTVLMIGVFVAILFELTLKLQRASLIDDAGRTADRLISSRVFKHMINLKSDVRPPSLGSLASQIREINQIREAMSSSMLSAAIDLPFSLIFVGVIFLLGGLLVMPILVAMALVLLIGLIAQIPLARLAKDGMEEANLRNGLIVETVLKADEIKLQQAEPTMELRWLRAVETANDIGVRQRRLRNFLTSSAQSIQQMAYICVVSLGAYFVITGDFTVGEVIACSILTNRALVPLAQVANVLGALQSSVLSKRSIDSLMTLATDIPGKHHLRRRLNAPSYALKNFRYSYPGTEVNGLIIPKMDIPHGTHVGIVGKIGAGKSTFLRVLSGLIEATQGAILLDGTELKNIHPDDLRRAIGFQSQQASLMRGTVRDNLKVAKPSASDEHLMQACEISGAQELVTRNPHGLDLVVNEAGEGLSGGQKQSILLARTILRDPPIVLLDEPTASMDSQTEANFIRVLSQWGRDKTIVIATHRSPPLSICSRLMVIDEGRITLDGPHDEVMENLRRNGAAK